MSEAGYLVRQRGSDFEVTKWEDSSEPTAIYRVRQGSKRWFCNSPGCHRTNKCKHAVLVESWLKRPRVEVPDRMLQADGRSF